MGMEKCELRGGGGGGGRTSSVLYYIKYNQSTQQQQQQQHLQRWAQFSSRPIWWACIHRRWPKSAASASRSSPPMPNARVRRRDSDRRRTAWVIPVV